MTACERCGEESGERVCPDCANWLDNYEPSDADLDAQADGIARRAYESSPDHMAALQRLK
jgi:hypothetical protein